MFKIAGNTLKYFEKKRNGDHFCSKDISDEEILIGIVADGVSGQPCDWFASELSCDKFIEFFEQNKLNDIEKRIEKSIVLTNEKVKEEEGDCQRMCSTFSLIVWKYVSNECFIVNIGDSRIYKVYDDNLVQLSRDDSIKGTSILTNVIGMASTKIKVERISFLENESILLASDGFYTAEKSAFVNDMVQVCRSEDLNIGLNHVFSKYDFNATDDMTALIIKNKNET